MALTPAQLLRARVRRARGKCIAMAVSYSLGTFNDNFFRQACNLMAISMGSVGFQSVAMTLFGLPYLIFAAPAGWLADRFPKRRVVIAAKALEVVAMICGAIGILTGTWPLMLAMVCMMGLQSAIFGPSLNGSIPELYPASYVTAANARLKVATTGAILLGVALAGPMLDMGRATEGQSREGRIGVAAVVLSVSLLGLLASLGVPRRRAAAPRQRFPWAGPLKTFSVLWEIRKDRLLAVTIATNMFVWFTGAIGILIVNLMGVDQFGLSKSMTSMMTGAQLVGIAIGGMLAGRLARGRYWYRVLTPAALGLAVVMAAVSLVPALPTDLVLPLLFVLLCLMGLLGGLMLVSCEAFVQVRPPADRKGTVIAAANFAVFVGIVLSGSVSYGLLQVLLPTDCFLVMGILALVTALCLLRLLPAGPGNLRDMLLLWAVRRLLRLRYRITVTGLDRVAEGGTSGVLFLPNHPALIEPVIMLAVLYGRFAPRAWADEDQTDWPVIRPLAERLHVRRVPGMARHRSDSRERIHEALEDTVADLRHGECVLLYPAGHIFRQRLEDLRGNTAVHTILSEMPDARVVLARTRGLWGSRFSWASGRAPALGTTLKKAVVDLLLSGIFFAPRRRITIEFYEPRDLPVDADPEALSDYLERYYNEDAPFNTYVPYTPWERGGVRTMPEPFVGADAGDVGRVPPATREIVVEHLRQESGASEITADKHLARDLGIDSLGRAELIAWVEGEFGFHASDTDSVQTVADVLLAACGELVRGEPQPLRAVPARWHRRGEDRRVRPAEGDTIAASFLRAARREPGRIICADQVAGARTYRDLVTAVMVLRPEVEALPGERIGIMMPASVAANVLYLTALFAGKTPVMVNWTVGPRNVAHSLDLAGVQRVLTARAVAERVAAQGIDLSSLSDRFVYLEDVARAVPRSRKLAAWLRARLSWRSLDRAPVSEVAAVLFTSGSESLPKAVPLTHDNILANVRDVTEHVNLRTRDRLLGFMPPFHSFGLACTVVLPLCSGWPTVYHANPTEAGMLSRLIDAYGVTVILGTPTFLNGIVRASTREQLATLRMAVTGAEKCPERVYDALAEMCPQTVVIEGYGITECSPIVSANTEDAPKPMTIGRPLAAVEHAIVAVDSGERVAQGERGMLLVRGPSIFGGYLNYDGPSPFVDFEGKEWYRTGDLISEDEDGVLTFRGRLKRFIKLGGEMISLPAIEAVLEASFPPAEDGAPQIAVEATPDEEHPEVVLFTMVDAEREAANAHIREAGLSALHNVRRVVRVEEIPLLGTGKTDYRALREKLTGSNQ